MDLLQEQRDQQERQDSEQQHAQARDRLRQDQERQQREDDRAKQRQRDDDERRRRDQEDRDRQIKLDAERKTKLDRQAAERRKQEIEAEREAYEATMEARQDTDGPEHEVEHEDPLKRSPGDRLRDGGYGGHGRPPVMKEFAQAGSTTFTVTVDGRIITVDDDDVPEPEQEAVPKEPTSAFDRITAENKEHTEKKQNEPEVTHEPER